MFTLTPLAAALQGIGYGSLLTALQGLLAVTIAPPEPPPASGHGAPSVRRKTRRRVASWSQLPIAVAPLIEDEDELALRLLGVL